MIASQNAWIKQDQHSGILPPCDLRSYVMSGRFGIRFENVSETSLEDVSHSGFKFCALVPTLLQKEIEIYGFHVDIPNIFFTVRISICMKWEDMP